MRIQILYFAYFRERLNQSEQALELAAHATVSDALTLLSDSHESIREMTGRFRVALNQEFVDSEAKLHEGDILALIPPVAGGAGPRPRYAEILSNKLSLDRVIEKVSEKGMGGIVTFTGQVRDTNLGHQVVRLEYEAYKEMATQSMASLCDQIEAQIPGTRLAVEHRVGILDIGDAAVVIAAAHPHRAQAFEACQALINKLKESVPIWKKETDPSGQEWIGMGP